MLTALCGLAGAMALLCMGCVVLALVPASGLGIAGLSAALGFAVVSVGAGLGAGMLALRQDRRA